MSLAYRNGIEISENRTPLDEPWNKNDPQQKNWGVQSKFIGISTKQL